MTNRRGIGERATRSSRVAQPPPAFTDPVLAASVTSIGLVHINELRAAVLALE